MASRSPIVALLINLGFGCALVILAVTPRLPALPTPFTDVDAHAVAYGIEAVLLYWLAGSWFAAPVCAALAWLGAGSFGVFTEILQIFEPSRASEARDLVADFTGVTVAVLALLVARRGPALWQHLTNGGFPDRPARTSSAATL